MVVQVAPQGRGVIGHDASGPQAVGHFKIRLFIKAPKYHLGGERGIVSQQLDLGLPIAPSRSELCVEASPQPNAAELIVQFSEIFHIGFGHTHY